MSGSTLSVAGTLNLVLGQTKTVTLDATVEPGGVTPPPQATIAADTAGVVNLGTAEWVAGTNPQDFTQPIAVTGVAVGSTVVRALNSAGVDNTPASDFLVVVVPVPPDSLNWDTSTFS